MLYSASVDSPLRSRKQRVDLRLQSPYSSNTPTQKAPIEVGHRPVVQSDIDFWSKLGRMHENLGVTTASPTVSILKSRPKSPVVEVNSSPVSTSPAPSGLSFKACKEETPGVAVDDDDSEVTINPHTLHIIKENLDASTNSEAGSPPTLPPTDRLHKHLNSSVFTFSPPVRTSFCFRTQDSSRRGASNLAKMDEVAKALCLGSYFTFSSPATYFLNKLAAAAPTSSSIQEEEGQEEEHESFGFSTLPDNEDTTECYSQVDEPSHSSPGSTSACADDISPADGDGNILDDDETESNVVQTEDGGSTDIFTPRRSKRTVKRPERYHF
ncbi:unnamed protein product [Mesocestoides corti]|uniref:Uncharacterized protein n=1 Tax=Mesocestoides corti TaxID=53468 RepID=A0A158QVE4_MESCO|nr:unnamed protein product [Mesocestoides corti]